MPLFHNVILGLFLIFFVKDCSSLKSLVLKVPPMVRVGTTVLMTCDYDLEGTALYAVKWYRNNYEFFRYIPKEAPPFKVFHVPHINVDVSNSGPKTLTLINATREQAGEYICEVSEDAPFFQTEMAAARLVVAELPYGSVELTARTFKVSEGHVISATCVAPPSFPAANLTWYINDDELRRDLPQVSFLQVNRSIDHVDDLLSSISKLNVILEESFYYTNFINLRCTANIESQWVDYADKHIEMETPQPPPDSGSTPFRSFEDTTLPWITDGCQNSHRDVKIFLTAALILSFLATFR